MVNSPSIRKCRRIRTLIVTPTPQGVETMVDLRSADAPTETSYELGLPPTASLRADEQGGAEVVEGMDTTLLIQPPTAVDAAGNPVETELKVSADSVTVLSRPTPSTVFPVLVDPTFIQEGWEMGGSGRRPRRTRVERHLHELGRAGGGSLRGLRTCFSWAGSHVRGRRSVPLGGIRELGILCARIWPRYFDVRWSSSDYLDLANVRHWTAVLRVRQPGTLSGAGRRVVRREKRLAG